MNLAILFGIVTLCLTTNLRAEQETIPQCSQDEVSLPTPNSDSYDGFTEEQKIRGLKIVTDGLNRFAVNFYKNVSISIKGNWVCTPLSVSLALSMAVYGSRRNTKIELVRLLGIPKKNTYVVRAGIRYLLDSLAEYKTVNLAVANKVYLASAGITPMRKFTYILSESHRSITDEVDPRYSHYSRNRLEEKWLAVQGDKATSHIIGMSDIGFDPMLILASEVYLRSNSVLGFQHRNTHMGRFWKNGIKKGLARMMFACSRYRYGEIPEVDISFVEIPLQSDGTTNSVSMFVLLPKKRSGLHRLQRHLDRVTVDKLMRGKLRNVHLWLPRFEIENFLWLESPLKSMGLQTTFSTQSNFSKIDPSPLVLVRGGGHAARIRVREDDPADGINPSTSAHNYEPNPADDENVIRFMVDRPFMTLTMTRTSESFHPTIIQIARVTSP